MNALLITRFCIAEGGAALDWSVTSSYTINNDTTEITCLLYTHHILVTQLKEHAVQLVEVLQALLPSMTSLSCTPQREQLRRYAHSKGSQPVSQTPFELSLLI